LSTRTQSHVTDSAAVKAVICAIPNYWVVRELTERDYGIDLMVEIFVPGKKDKRGLDTFEASGGLFHIQIKGSSDPIPVTKKGYVSYSLEKGFLKYVESFSVPSFLFYVDLAECPAKIYVRWLQGYIRSKLDFTNDFQWREQTDAVTVRVRIPRTVF